MARDLAYFADMLDAARLAISYVQNEDRASFLSDIQCQDSVIRRLEIIGEAARRVSDHTRAAHPEIPWKAMISMRNQMIHEYDGVDLEVVWNTVQKDPPGLIVLLDKLVPPII
ncbi:MAG: DUF86 domain-containing protein [Desulfococcaceae bacterium]